jgi:hypothetical protein
LGENALVSNQLTPELKSQIFAQQSGDPYLTLVTLWTDSFTYRLVNNTEDIVSNGNLYTAFPMKVRLPADDGESAKDFQLEFDNASLLLIASLRSVTEPVNCQIDMILASMPDVVQMTAGELLVKSISYDKSRIVARIVLDNFLASAMTSERYTPSLYPGMF